MLVFSFLRFLLFFFVLLLLFFVILPAAVGVVCLFGVLLVQCLFFPAGVLVFPHRLAFFLFILAAFFAPKQGAKPGSLNGPQNWAILGAI